MQKQTLVIIVLISATSLLMLVGLLLYLSQESPALSPSPTMLAEETPKSPTLPTDNIFVSTTTIGEVSTTTYSVTTSEPTPPPEKPREVKIVTVASTTSATHVTPSNPVTPTVTSPPIIKKSVPIVPPKPAPYTPLEWGVFAGSNAGVINAFADKVEENPDYLSYFVHWGNGGGELPSFLHDVAAKKSRTLVIFWEASDYQIGGTNQPAYAYRNILNGNWDDYFEDFADQLEDYGGPIILVPFSELNGNWTPWSGTTNGNTPQEAVEGFRYVHGFFDHLENVKIGWAINAASVPNTSENQIQNYYPGSEYVDIVGVDGFNKGDPWLTFSEIFHKPLTLLASYNKPVFIFSFASAEGYRKADWMEDAFFTQMPKYPQIQAWIWFNQNKERNWLIWSNKDTLSVFERALQPGE